MFVKLPNNREAKIGVKYEYVKNNESHQQEPVGTKVFITVTKNTYKDSVNEVHVLLKPEKWEFEGHALIKNPDQFSRKQGRRWAMISLFKRDKENGSLLSYEDRRILFNSVCPYFGGYPVWNCDVKPSFKKSVENLLDSKESQKDRFWMKYEEWEDYLKEQNISESIFKWGFIIAFIITSAVLISHFNWW